MISPKVGDYIKTTFFEDGESGLILEVLNPTEYWSRGLGVYPTHVFRILRDNGTVDIWDFFQMPNDELEFEVVSESG